MKRSHTKPAMYIVVGILMALMLLTSVTGLFGTHDVMSPDPLPDTESGLAESGSSMSEPTESKGPSRSTNDHDGHDAVGSVDHEHRLTELKNQMIAMLEGYEGEWSAYVKELSTDDWFVINDHRVYPGSMIKLFALAACYQKIEDGALSESDQSVMLDSMVVMSNNQAFNNIVRAVGTTYITEWCVSHGYLDTAQYHGLVPSTNAEGLETEPLDNTTSPCDVGRLLESIYRGRCVSEKASEKMVGLLSRQYFRGKIPSGVPEGVKVANKTGDTYNISHDAAIVYSDGGDYVLVIMAEAESIAFDLEDCFTELSKTVYEFFN